MKRRGTWLEYYAENSAPLHVNEWLLKQAGATKGVIAHYRRNSGLMVNGAILTVENPVVAIGDAISLEVFKPEESGTVPELMGIEILFEDEHLVAVNKPPNMKTHPNFEGETGTLANALAFHFMMEGAGTAIRHVHRLDEDTSGAILFAKHALAQGIMDRELQDHLIARTYLAAVHGLPRPAKGTVSVPIGKDRHHASRRRVSPGGQPAVTHYEVIQHNGSDSILKVSLETGRTHQIRVHLSHIGHPIIGDKLYGRPSSLINRQALHAAHISFSHPITKELLTLDAPIPKDMRRWKM
ncbi:RluA family pseudouridine synthase [Metabacillus sp. 84]|uniref:RluA family pseudouridine synthase n=1 Tax=unclassified Metabacillus TaxID=2675274 RepID=UPI003CFB0624